MLIPRAHRWRPTPELYLGRPHHKAAAASRFTADSPPCCGTGPTPMGFAKTCRSRVYSVMTSRPPHRHPGGGAALMPSLVQRANALPNTRRLPHRLQLCPSESPRRGNNSTRRQGHEPERVDRSDPTPLELCGGRRAAARHPRSSSQGWPRRAGEHDQPVRWGGTAGRPPRSTSLWHLFCSPSPASSRSHASFHDAATIGATNGFAERERTSFAAATRSASIAPLLVGRPNPPSTWMIIVLHDHDGPSGAPGRELLHDDTNCRRSPIHPAAERRGHRCPYAESSASREVVVDSPARRADGCEQSGASRAIGCASCAHTPISPARESATGSALGRRRR